MRGLLVVAVLGVAAVTTAPPAAAQVDCILDPTAPECQETTTSEPPSTTSTTEEEPSTTSTTPRSTTTSDTTAVDDSTTTSEPASTTSLPALLEEGPPTDVAGPAQATTTTTTVPADTGDSGDETGRQVFLVVTGLLVLAVVFALLTYWYWRRTRPVPAKPAASSPS